MCEGRPVISLGDFDAAGPHRDLTDLRVRVPAGAGQVASSHHCLYPMNTAQISRVGSVAHHSNSIQCGLQQRDYYDKCD